MIGRLVFVRHGVTHWNREGRFQGRLDPGLSEEGQEEARLMAERLAAESLRPARIISSPLSRARETADAILAALEKEEVEMELDPRLMEVGQGEWEGHTHDELAVSDPVRYAAWRDALAGERQPPGGEPLPDAIGRVSDVLDEAIRSSNRESAWPLCLVSHGGTLRLAAHVLLEIPLERVWRLELDNASISVMDRMNGQWRIVTWNDGAHLLGHAPVHVDEEDGRPLAL